MPRISDEARSAAAFREGGEHPKPPAHMNVKAKKVWHEIVDCRSVDFFQPGALHLLEQLCVMVVAARRVAEIIEEDPLDHHASDVYTKYIQRCAMHCQKLRLSIQSALRSESGRLTEREPKPKGEKGKKVALFGANVVKLGG